MAHGGTLFLDEIGDMDLRTQAKILRAIQEKTIEKVGDTQSVSIDVRIVAATNKDLQLAIQNGDFREDLYYRLNVVPFHMMPLRDRKEDIPLLMQYFMNRHSKDLGEPIKDISDDARNLLHNYPWPGNVRELKNIVERLWILARGSEITVEDLPREITHAHDAKSQTQSNSSLRRAKSDFERGFILDKLEENDWNVSKTADVIGLERSHLYRKLKTFDIDPKRLKG
jgi:two-component system nitrogen regulation response regulator NtrX